MYANKKRMCFNFSVAINCTTRSCFAHILNAEGEKIQRIVCDAKCLDDLLAVNDSVTNTIKAISELEEMLKDKAIAVLAEFDNKTC